MEKFSLLTSVGNENEADIIKALLDSNSIPVVIKHRGNGSYLNIYMGTSYEGIDIFVPEECLVEAHGLIKGQVILQETLPEDKDFDNNREKPQDKKRNLMLILMVLVSISIVISLIVKTIQ